MFGAKLSDLLLAEKNVVDFVEKNLGQERDRLKQNDLEMDPVCNHLNGGLLDYPVMISHDFCDITTAWDVYVEAFTKETKSKIPKPYGFGLRNKPFVKNDRLGKMPFRGDELSVKQFINAVVCCGVKIRTHIVECTEECVESGRLESLYVIISNVVIIRNYIWVFLEVFDSDPKSKLKGEYKLFCDLVEIIAEQMLQCQANLLTTYILHDENSQNWSSHQPYYEGERGSPVVQMWTYFLRAIQRDMWKIMPPLLSQRILAIILNDSLAILTSRYSKIKPTEESVPQFVADTANILAAVEEFLFFISPDLPSVCGQSEPPCSKIIYSIHLKCHCLVSSLILIGCPLQILYKMFRRGMSSCSLMEIKKRDHAQLTEAPWMSALSLLCPRFYPSGLSYPDWELLFSMKLLCAQPTANWALVYKVITMNDCKVAGFILSLFPAVIAPTTDFLLEGNAWKRCLNASCTDLNCHSLPSSMPNHFAATCCLYVVAHAMPRDYTSKVYRCVLPMILDWRVMDKTQIWNSSNRPVWFQSLIDILLPILKTCVQSLCISMAEAHVAKSTKDPTLVPNAPAPLRANLRHIHVDSVKEDDASTQWVIELLNTLTEILSIIPRGFFLVCEDMDDLIPREFQPVRNNVAVHFLVTALYVLLNLGPDLIKSILGNEFPVKAEANNPSEISTTKESYPSDVLDPNLLATAERLCHLDDPIFDQAVHRLVTQMESMMKQTLAQNAKKERVGAIPSDFSLEWDVSTLRADFLLEEVEGQLALRVVYWFIVSHGDLLEKMITGDVNKEEAAKKPKISNEKIDVMKITNAASPVVSNALESQKTSRDSMTQVVKASKNMLKIGPRIRTSFKPANVIHEFHFVNKYRTFDEIIWSSRNLDWVQTVRQCRIGLQKNIIGKLLERRWEFQPKFLDDNSVSATDPSERTKMQHIAKMVNEIKSLLI